MRRILVGVDGTPEARRAAHWAANMAQAEGKQLLLAHVLPEEGDAGPFEAAYTAWREERKAESLQEMEDVAQLEARAGAPVATKLLDGDDTARALAQAARDDELVELVVVGHRLRGPFSRALDGSVAERLVQICDKPVLVVH